jgi:hypothetical protein
MKAAKAAKLTAALRKVKQRKFNEMVEGEGGQPAEVVDSVLNENHITIKKVT